MPVRDRVWGAGRVVVIGAGLVGTFVLFFLVSMGIAIRSRNTTVPDVSGKTVAEAEQLLTRAGLDMRLDPIRRPDLKVPADHVLSQDPSASQPLRRGRTVQLRVSDGPNGFPVPDLTGLSEDEAKQRLTAAGIQLTATAEIRAGDINSNQVVAQDPPARAKRSSAAILVNRGAQGTTYVMPDVIGAPERRVTDLLRLHGFRVTIVGYAAYPGLAGGVVIKQSPQAGFQIPPGETIALEVSR